MVDCVSFESRPTRPRATAQSPPRLISHSLISLHAMAPSTPSCHLRVCVVQTVLPHAARGPSIFPSNRCCARTACSIRAREQALFCGENRWPLGLSLENLSLWLCPQHWQLCFYAGPDMPHSQINTGTAERPAPSQGGPSRALILVLTL